MVLTIFRKDFRLLWPGVIAVALLQAALSAFEAMKGPFGDFRNAHNFAKLMEMERLLEGVVLAGIALLISLAVHQDALPQIDLDWLIRPIKRRQLAVAKMVFFIACIQAPMFVFDVAGCLAGGFDLQRALMAALSRNLFFLIGFTVPAFSIAAVTRNAIEVAIGIGILVVLVEMLDRGMFYLFDAMLLQSIFQDQLYAQSWVIVVTKYLVITIGSAIVLTLQYGRRKTALSRPVFAAFILLGFAANFLPWQAASRVQELVSGGSPIELSLDQSAAGIKVFYQPGEEGVAFRVPIRVSDLPAGAQLVMDWHEGEAKVSGRTLEGFSGIVNDENQGPWLDRGLKGRGFVSFVAHGVTLDQIKDWPAADFAIDLAVTMVEKQGDDIEFPVSEDFAPLPKLGRCRITNPGRFAAGTPPLVAECAQAGNVSGVTTMSAFSPDRAEPFAVGMTPFGTSPFFAQLLPDAAHRLAVGMNPKTLLATADFYPNSHVVMSNYRPVAHRLIHLALKGVKLQDWAVER